MPTTLKSEDSGDLKTLATRVLSGIIQNDNIE